MLFQLTSFHVATDGGVKPKNPLFIKASTWFNAKRVIAAYLEVPSDEVLLSRVEEPYELPLGAQILDERNDQMLWKVA